MMILIRLAHLLWEQGVVGSNPATPTEINKLLIFSVAYFCIYPLFHLSK